MLCHAKGRVQKPATQPEFYSLLHKDQPSDTDKKPLPSLAYKAFENLSGGRSDCYLPFYIYSS